MLFISSVYVGPVRKDSFHVHVSHKLNQNIVVTEPAKPRKFRPRLPKPPAKLFAATVSPVVVVSHKISKEVDSQLLLPRKSELPETNPKESRMVKSKKTKEDISNEYQQGYGAKYSKLVTTTCLGMSPALQPP